MRAPLYTRAKAKWLEISWWGRECSLGAPLGPHHYTSMPKPNGWEEP